MKRKFKQIDSEISLILDDYDDLFSDFDPRPYSEKALSDDFLEEAKRASRDKYIGVTLILLVPKKLRRVSEENLIKKRLCEHFKKHYKKIGADINSIKRKGLFMALLGAFLITIATYLSSLQSQNISIHFLKVLLEPAGWFTGWTGLDHIIYVAGGKKNDFEFYEKMSKCRISFMGY